jgi:type I restriction enzyme R subunit
MTVKYTGRTGEAAFEADFIDLLIQAGWEKKILRYQTVDQLIDNWMAIIFERNRSMLNNVPLSQYERDAVLEIVRTQADTPVKASHFITGAPIAIRRDSDSADTEHAGKDVLLNMFNCTEIAGGSSRYQIAEQTIFLNDEQANDRRGDLTLLIDGIPVIQIELKASGVDISEATGQILKYSHEGVFRGFMGLVQVFWGITPEDAVFFSNAGSYEKFNSSFFFRWGDRDNKVIKDWKELITGEYHILSIPEAHKLVAYYVVADTAKDILKVCRCYQYEEIRAIVSRTSKQKWGDHNQLGGYVWCTTGGGKTMTTFKAGQLIIDMNLADKVVFVVDRKTLDEQSGKEYDSFQRVGEHVATTKTTGDLLSKLGSNNFNERMIITSIQKMSRITSDESQERRSADLEAIRNKRIVFIIDEAHRSQFGEMHQQVKDTFYFSLFFGFTGTPILNENMRDGEMTTESVFGPCLAIYTLAAGIHDGNVLGFWPEAVKTYSDSKLKEAVALHECHAIRKEDIPIGTENWKLFRKLMEKTPMASELDEYGNIKRGRNGDYIKGIEDYLPSQQYNNDEHRSKVVENILTNFTTISQGEYGTLFHGLLATSSIAEAYEYWKLFRANAPEMNVTALFDPNIAGDNATVIEKEKALADIVTDYNRMFDTRYDRNTDPNYSAFKSDLTARLSHKEPYQYIGSNHDKCLDIVIVVDQLLTGFDSNYLNVLYLDKELETDALIQAISRTNRVCDANEKPWGMVKFYRKPYTMQRNLKEALKLYCQGNYTGVEVSSLAENIVAINNSFDNISAIFAADRISNFEHLPASDESRQKFRKEFYCMKSTLRASILQGFKWTNEYGKQLDFDENIYHVLYMRYKDLPSNRGGTGGNPHAGYILPTQLSTMEMDKIDSDYLEEQFKIVTMADIEAVEENISKKQKAIDEINKNLGLLSAIQQKYARQILKDITNGVLEPTEGKTFRKYIQEYSNRAVMASVKEFAGAVGLDSEELYDLYQNTGARGVDTLKLERLEDNVNEAAMSKHYACSTFKAHIKLHKELMSYIAGRKAEKAE